MARCSGSGGCSCVVESGPRVRVSGQGTSLSPYVVEALPLSIAVQDSSTVSMSMTGTGTQADPWVISAELLGPALENKWGYWRGTQAQYDALGAWDDETLYFVKG